ncbi:hypothetical protein QQP08_004486, partial [Theobroma cacao]
MSTPDMVELATVYVKHLQRQLEELKQRKMQLEGESEALNSNSNMRLDMKFALSDIISLIEEEGATVIAVTYNNAGTMNILSIHCKMSISSNLELATVHIKELQRQVEELKERKMQLEVASEARNRVKSETITPVLNIIESDSIMEVNLVIGSDMKFILGEIISIIEQEGAEVIGATYNHAGKVNRNILSIHCEVACSKIGFKSSKVLERLKTLFGDC